MTLATQPETHGTETYDLSTAPWALTDSQTGQSWPARVPGSVHSDLLTAAAIPDPFYGENEAALAWIGERDWTYSCEFTLPRSFVGRRRQVLRFEGLDT